MPSSGPSRGNSWKGAIVQRADLDVVNDGPDKAVSGQQPCEKAGPSEKYRTARGETHAVEDWFIHPGP